jgi:hypothetical protein
LYQESFAYHGDGNGRYSCSRTNTS